MTRSSKAPSEKALARRAVVKGAALGLIAGTLTDTLPANAAAESGEIWSSEYWAKKDGISLYIYRKRLVLRA